MKSIVKITKADKERYHRANPPYEGKTINQFVEIKESTHKICDCCHRVVPVEYFHSDGIDKTHLDGRPRLRNICKSCNNKRIKAQKKKRHLRSIASKAYDNAWNRFRHQVHNDCGELRFNKREGIGTVPQFQKCMEKLFQGEMTWDNYGKLWVIDHIKPLSIFDLTRKDEQLIATCLTNLQPMYNLDNLYKSNKLLH